MLNQGQSFSFPPRTPLDYYVALMMGLSFIGLGYCLTEPPKIPNDVDRPGVTDRGWAERGMGMFYVRGGSGINADSSAAQLRRNLDNFRKDHPDLRVVGTVIGDPDEVARLGIVIITEPSVNEEADSTAS